MDDETRTAFDEIRRGFQTMERRFDGVDLRLDAMDGRFDAMDRRFDATDAKIDTVRREAGVVAEDLRSQLQLVAEIVGANAQAIDRLTTEMNARFRENEIVVRAAFRHIRRDIDELRDRL